MRAGVGRHCRAKRILRLATRVGEIGVRFEGSEQLHDADVIFGDDDRLVIAVVVDARHRAEHPAGFGRVVTDLVARPLPARMIES